MKKLEQNITHVQELGSNFVKKLNSRSRICNTAHLKYLDIERYKIIFVVEKDIYFDFERMYPLYQQTKAFEKAESNEDFTVEVSFIPSVDSLNTHRLMSDSYIFQYDRK